MRTWNLSSLWRLPTATGAAWLKAVPPFFAHEGAVLAALAPRAVPPLQAADGARALLAEVPGEDQYEAAGADLPPMVEMLVALQADWAGRTAELLALGAPDWRAAPLTELLGSLVDHWAPKLEPDVAGRLVHLASGLPDRFAQAADCGLPDTLVHGDFHRGNLRGAAGRLVLLDWGDCGVGHPMLDQPAFLSPLSAEDRDMVAEAWAQAWEDRIPGCEPARAADVLRPVAALRQALVYQKFLDGIEPHERIYHASDPALWLARAAALAG
jgi:Ser/Thr protein kinase RdoA (MazF antagonist)